jgi:hypothetical protein
MAHNLLRDQMAFVGEPPWHRLGKVVLPGVTSDEMLKAAGLDWKVRKIPATGSLRTARWHFSHLSFSFRKAGSARMQSPKKISIF